MPREKKILPALDNASKISKPDLPDIADKNYTDTILKYGGLATRYPQLETEAKTVVAAINELNKRPVPDPGGDGKDGHDGTLVIANPPIPGTVLETSAGLLLQTDKNRLIEISTGEYVGELYSINIDGEIYTIDTGSEYLADLLDVDVADATSGQVLKFDGDKWINADDSSGVSNLWELNDVDLSELSTGQVLTYNGEDWINADPASVPSTLDDLTNVDIDEPENGQVLKYSDGNWINATDSSGITKLEELEDVDVSGVTDGQFLKYDGNEDEWIPGKPGNDYVWEGTQAQYDALPVKNPEVTYYITDGQPTQFTADAVVYNNSGTKLLATNVQAAINEIVTTNIYWTDISGVLVAGNTSIQFHNSVITPNSTVNVYVDSAFYGTSPTAISVLPQYVVLEFEEQESDMPVKVRIS